MTPEAAIILLALGTHEITVTMHVYPTVQAVEIACRERYQGLPITPLDGCAVLRAGTCTIHVAAPRSWRDRAAMVRLGHEIAHCTGARHQE